MALHPSTGILGSKHIEKKITLNPIGNKIKSLISTLCKITKSIKSGN